AAGLEVLDHLVRPAAGEPEGALVLLHGRGVTEHDLFGLLDLLDPDRRLVGYAPGGPFALPPGGRHWYVVPRVGYPDPETFFSSLERLEAFLDATGVPLERTMLGGFSQGTAMGYALGLRAADADGAGHPGVVAREVLRVQRDRVAPGARRAPGQLPAAAREHADHGRDRAPAPLRGQRHAGELRELEAHGRPAPRARAGD